MSIESAKLFVERMKTDEDFAKAVTECKDAEARMTFVKTAGFDFTPTEIKTVNEELSDTDLDAIAGGANKPCNTVGGILNPQYQPR